MINLEKHIKEQRLLIDSDSPREGHEERFLQKLGRDVDSHPVRKFNFRHGLQIAASIAIILTSAIVLMKQNRSGEIKKLNLKYTGCIMRPCITPP